MIGEILMKGAKRRGRERERVEKKRVPWGKGVGV